MTDARRAPPLDPPRPRLSPGRLARGLLLPALAGAAAALGVIATADPAAVAEAGGARALLSGCVRFCYLAAAAAELAAGLAAWTDGGPFGDGEPAEDADEVWRVFPNGFDVAALAGAAAYAVLRLAG